MGKHKKWTLEEKVKIVKEFKNGVTISYLNNKYGINGFGTVSRWNKEYDEGRLGVDNRGNHYDDGVLLGTQYDITGFSFICNDAETLAYLLNTTVDNLPEHIKYMIKGHIDLLESYCRKHGLECNLKYEEDEIQ